MRDYAVQIARLRECASNSHEVHSKCGAYLSGVCAKTRDIRMQDAADAIEELLARVPQWISVEERLPEGNGTRYEYDLEESNLVLVYGINHIGEMAYGLGSYIYDHADPKDSGWNGYMDCDYDLDYCTVTHWMPLPEPPKEVE